MLHHAMKTYTIRPLKFRFVDWSVISEREALADDFAYTVGKCPNTAKPRWFALVRYRGRHVAESEFSNRRDAAEWCQRHHESRVRQFLKPVKP